MYMHNCEAKLEVIDKKIKELKSLPTLTEYQVIKLEKLMGMRRDLHNHIDNRIIEMLEIVGDC